MKSIMIYKKWDIILVPFPFTDLSPTKKRPGLIVSPNAYNEGADIVIAFITSKVDREKRLGDYLIKEWALSKLPKPSLLRMKFATIEKSIIIKKIGKLSKYDISQFQAELVNFFKN
jgi:mRNA-degrading endonuclease toxin of MazEF toxin-antitoxin module